MSDWTLTDGADEIGHFSRLDFPGGSCNFRTVPAGTFTMGSPPAEPGRFDDEVQHEVTLTRPFQIGETPVTQALWKAVMGENPSRFVGDDRPVERVGWDDCGRFIDALNARVPGLNARLPTEAEWECACLAGTAGARYGELDVVAQHHGNASRETHPVGEKKPNAWGLYDMLGNVYERCQDWYGAYPEGPATDPTGPETGSYRVVRGGSRYCDARYVRAAYRYWSAPADRFDFLGLRLARGQEPGAEPVPEAHDERSEEGGAGCETRDGFNSALCAPRVDMSDWEDRDRAAAHRAERVALLDYDGPVWEVAGDRFWDSLNDAIDDLCGECDRCDECDLPATDCPRIPARMWTAEPRRLTIDIDRAIEQAEDGELADDMEPSVASSELRAAVDQWNDEHAQTVWERGRRVVVLRDSDSDPSDPNTPKEG